MESSELSLTLAYVVFSVCFVFTPNEFRSAGLTIQNLFSSWLGSEDVNFIQYHVRRTSVTVLVHSVLPLGQLHTLPLPDINNQWLLLKCAVFYLVKSKLAIKKPACSLVTHWVKV